MVNLKRCRLLALPCWHGFMRKPFKFGPSREAQSWPLITALRTPKEQTKVSSKLGTHSRSRSLRSGSQHATKNFCGLQRSKQRLRMRRWLFLASAVNEFEARLQNRLHRCVKNLRGGLGILQSP